jgi:serine/threonine protein kinase
MRVHNWGVEGTRIYIATDPPRGVTLQYVLDNENIDFERALYLSQQLAQGLKAFHEQGISGLDLRPPLITIDTVGISDRVQIDDIGLHTLLHALGYMDGQPIYDVSYLDPRYAPPEYINKDRVGAWSDIYQVGLLLFILITGRLPFVGHNPAETGIMQSNDPIPRMSQYKRDTPEAFQEVVNDAMAKDPAARFADVEALLKALGDVQLPPRSRSSTLQAGKSMPGSTNLTNEMTALDYAMQTTTIEGLAPPPSESGMTIRAAETIDSGTFAYLLYEKAGAAQQRIPIRQKNVIVGRIDPKRGLNPDIDLSAIDPKMTVSRQHARIRFEETFFYVEDLKSRNKTRLGELPLKPLEAALLQHGEVLHFGSVRMRFEIVGRGRLSPLKNNHEKV